MQVETKKTRMCVHEYIIYIYILKCTKMYKRYLNKQKKEETNNNDARRSPLYIHGGCCRLVKGTSQRYVSFHFYI